MLFRSAPFSWNYVPWSSVGAAGVARVFHWFLLIVPQWWLLLTLILIIAVILALFQTCDRRKLRGDDASIAPEALEGKEGKPERACVSTSPFAWFLLGLGRLCSSVLFVPVAYILMNAWLCMGVAVSSRAPNVYYGTTQCSGLLQCYSALFWVAFVLAIILLGYMLFSMSTLCVPTSLLVGFGLPQLLLLSVPVRLILAWSARILIYYSAYWSVLVSLWANVALLCLLIVWLVLGGARVLSGWAIALLLAVDLWCVGVGSAAVALLFTKHRVSLRGAFLPATIAMGVLTLLTIAITIYVCCKRRVRVAPEPAGATVSPTAPPSAWAEDQDADPVARMFTAEEDAGAAAEGRKGGRRAGGRPKVDETMNAVVISPSSGGSAGGGDSNPVGRNGFVARMMRKPAEPVPAEGGSMEAVSAGQPPSPRKPQGFVARMMRKPVAEPPRSEGTGTPIDELPPSPKQAHGFIARLKRKSATVVPAGPEPVAVSDEGVAVQPPPEVPAASEGQQEGGRGILARIARRNAPLPDAPVRVSGVPVSVPVSAPRTVPREDDVEMFGVPEEDTVQMLGVPSGPQDGGVQVFGVTNAVPVTVQDDPYALPPPQSVKGPRDDAVGGKKGKNKGRSLVRWAPTPDREEIVESSFHSGDGDAVEHFQTDVAVRASQPNDDDEDEDEYGFVGPASDSYHNGRKDSGDDETARRRRGGDFAEEDEESGSEEGEESTDSAFQGKQRKGFGNTNVTRYSYDVQEGEEKEGSVGSGAGSDGFESRTRKPQSDGRKRFDYDISGVADGFPIDETDEERRRRLSKGGAGAGPSLSSPGRGSSYAGGELGSPPRGDAEEDSGVLDSSAAGEEEHGVSFTLLKRKEVLPLPGITARPRTYYR